MNCEKIIAELEKKYTDNQIDKIIDACMFEGKDIFSFLVR